MKNGNVVVKQSCHSRFCRPQDSGIYNAGRSYQRGKTLLNGCVEDPRLQISGMTPNLMGFTLIELLVVVLIIGILAAVAVPQYQKAVERSKATEAMSMLSSIAKAYQTHYLANGKWATKFNELDIDLPFTGNTVAMIINGNNGDTKSNKDWSFQIQEDSTLSTSGYITLFATRIDGKYKGAGFSINFENPSHTARKELRCFERISASNFLFDTDLPAGAYCERVMQGVFSSENQWNRSYQLP